MVKREMTYEQAECYEGFSSTISDARMSAKKKRVARKMASELCRSKNIEENRDIMAKYSRKFTQREWEQLWD